MADAETRRVAVPGVILADKPAGITSHDVVAIARRTFPRKTKVGHAGTLDPFATGLLLILVGRATRAQQFLLGLPKTYTVVARLGWRSSTGDVDGELEQTGSVPAEPAIAIGDLMQRPPAYSAVRVGGERLYEKARRGEAIEGEPRPVTVYRAQELWREGDRIAFEIECSAGTYIRQLVADLGDAYCESLQRTAIGPFSLEDADPERIVGVADALSFLPQRELDEDEARRVSHGVKLEARPGDDAALTCLTHAGELLSVAEPRGSQLAPVVVFAT